MKTILFFCVGNSSRSQMAEAFGKIYLGDGFEVFSAGTEALGVDPYASAAMFQTHGMNITTQQSKTVSEFECIAFDFVITLCPNPTQLSPFFPKSRHLYYAFKDPKVLASRMQTEAEKLDCYIKISNEIKLFVQSLPRLFPELFEN